MGWIKTVQALIFYISGIGCFFINRPELGMLFAIAACICDLTNVLEDKA